MLSCKFSRRPRSIALVGHKPIPTFFQADIDAAREEAYGRGRNAAAAERAGQFARHQAEMVELQRQTLEGLAARHDALIGQFCEMLPGLVMEAARRVLATVEIDEKIVKNIVSELITEIHPGADGLEISLNERDLELIEGVESMYDQKYPGICFISNRDLHPGDCIVRSRFGTLDGSIATKLDNVEALLQ